MTKTSEVRSHGLARELSLHELKIQALVRELVLKD